MPTDRSKLEFELVQSRNDQYFVRIRAPGNRANLARSELYTSKRAALNMIRVVRENAADGEIDDLTDDD